MRVGSQSVLVLILPALGFLAYQTSKSLQTDDLHPVVALEHTRHDFGTVRAGPKLHATFAVRNTGRSRLILSRMSTSCECAATATRETIVRPSGVCTLLVGVETKHLGGPVRLETSYSTNDPRRPVLMLAVLVNVVPAGRPFQEPTAAERSNHVEGTSDSIGPN